MASVNLMGTSFTGICFEHQLLIFGSPGEGWKSQEKDKLHFPFSYHTPPDYGRTSYISPPIYFKLLSFYLVAARRAA